jgi:mannose-6-phosphate isomerase-like protein (cupin superfamily)
MFSKKNLSQIPVEETPHATGSRKLLASKEEVSSPYFEAFTYGYLPAKEKWSMHHHENIVEICIVIKGKGLIRDENQTTEDFGPGDRFIFPANTNHEVENTGEEVAEFYFFRMRSK